MAQEKPKHIAVLRTAALGDICMTIPLLIALRDHFTDSKVYWILDENMCDLVDDLQGIELIKIKKPRSLKGWRACQKQLSHYHFDALLMPQSSMRSNLLSLFIKADNKYGYGKLHSKDFQSKFVNKTVTSVEEHLVDSFLRFAQAIGAPAEAPKWEIALSDSDKAHAKSLLPETTQPTVAICPVSSKQERNWAPERFAAIAKRLQKYWGAQVVLLGGADTASLDACQKITAIATQPIINASNKTSLKQLCALLEQTDLLIAPDTGPAHLANAVNTPVIGLYAVMKSEKTGPYYSIKHCVDKYDEAVKTILKKDPKETSWNLRVHSSQAMKLIQADEVYQRCCELLGELGYTKQTLEAS